MKIDKVKLVGLLASEIIMETNIKPTLLKMGIHFDEFFEESSLYPPCLEKILVDKIVENYLTT